MIEIGTQDGMWVASAHGAVYLSGTNGGVLSSHSTILEQKRTAYWFFLHCNNDVLFSLGKHLILTIVIVNYYYLYENMLTDYFQNIFQYI